MRLLGFFGRVALKLAGVTSVDDIRGACSKAHTIVKKVSANQSTEPRRESSDNSNASYQLDPWS